MPIVLRDFGYSRNLIHGHMLYDILFQYRGIYIIYITQIIFYSTLTICKNIQAIKTIKKIMDGLLPDRALPLSYLTNF